jgi:hypothetical protein
MRQHYDTISQRYNTISQQFNTISQHYNAISQHYNCSPWMVAAAGFCAQSAALRGDVNICLCVTDYMTLTRFSFPANNISTLQRGSRDFNGVLLNPC